MTMPQPPAPITPDEAPQTGAMIALVPTAADAARLALTTDGAEPVDDLHCTVLYLGEADQIQDAERQAILDWAEIMAANWERVDADAFAPAFFNPDGEEPCAVMVLNGPELAEFYETTAADVSDIVAVPAQHEPYIPHITLAYFAADVTVAAATAGQLSAVLGDMIARVGPLSFDRLRVAFAGENTDISLGEPVDDTADPVDEPIDETQEPADVPAESPPPASTMTAAAPVRELVTGCWRCGQDHIGACSV